MTWDGSLELCSGTTSSYGTFSCTFTVPVAVGGTHTVTAAEGAYAPSISFSVGASLSLSPSSGTVGTTVTATGEGYASAGSYLVRWGTGASLCSGTTQSNGAFSCRFTVPGSPEGTFSVLGSQGSSEAGAQFAVGPSVSLGVLSGPVGSNVTVSGAGLSAGAPVTVAWDSTTTVCAGAANASGGFECNFTVPFSAAGDHTVEVVQNSPVGSSLFQVVPSIGASLSSGTSGTSVELTGTGFDADAPFSVSWNATVVLCSGTTNSTGAFACAFTVPAGAATGPQSITVSEGGHVLEVTFTVAASPPPPPGPTAFPWWIVVVIVLVVAFLLFMVLIGERQRHAAHRHRRSGTGNRWLSSGPSGSGGASGSVTSSPVSVGDLATFDSVAGASTTASPTAEPAEDIDAMISRLERMSQQLFKKKPAELGDVSAAQLPPEDRPPTK